MTLVVSQLEGLSIAAATRILSSPASVFTTCDHPAHLSPSCVSISGVCERHGVAFFHKQCGTYASNPLVHDKGLTREQAERRDPKTNGKGGGLLRGLQLSLRPRR